MVKSNELRIGNLLYRKFWNPHPILPAYTWQASKALRFNDDTVVLEIDN